MVLVNTFFIAAIIIFCYMTGLFIIALIRKDNSIADIAWGLGFVIVAWSTLWIVGSFYPRQILACSLILIWGSRLSIRIFLRNRGRGEDPRYRKWREEWGRFFILRSYLQVFLLQGAILLINISPVLIINTTSDGNLNILDVCGLLVWITGFVFESVGDYQLDRFLADSKNRGTIIDRGLWRYTRHPNYFGEITMWWGIFIIALSVPYGWIGFVGPLAITLMIVFVSGIPMTERLMEKTPGFEEYRKRTSVLIPWFVKKR
jgi:steroid 5-alpha reductase family enzyme